MKAYDIIAKKRDGKKLDNREISFIVDGFVGGEIPDYQMSAWLMAISTRGMDEEETVDLTQAMASSGRQVDLSSVSQIVVDKHSTGGVGDKTTLVLAPMVAAAGAKVLKMSGRGLGHTGGTLDKLEAIPGFNVNLTVSQLVNQVKEIGIAIASASRNIAPADKKIYCLRDVTATVSSLPLIASSVMAKKIAGGAGAIMLDVKTGSGAFMKNLEDSKQLAQLMINIGKRLGKKMAAVVTDMNQPLGEAVGNSLEVKEAVDVLKNQGPEDVAELCFVLGSHMLVLSGVVSTLDEAKDILKETISSGKALDKFTQLIEAQGGDPAVVLSPDILSRAKVVLEYRAKRDGYISSIATERIGKLLVDLGGGRLTKEGKLDLSVGLVFQRKLADFVGQGDAIVKIHASDKEEATQACQLLDKSIALTGRQPHDRSLIHDTIT